MTSDNSFQEFPTYVKKSSPKVNPFVVLAVIVFLALIGGGGYYYFGVMKKESSKVSPVPTTPKPTVAVSPTVSASVSGIVSPTLKGQTTSATPTTATKGPDRSKLTIAVLNGSGTAGAAKGTSSHLESLGYVISKVENADDFTFKGLTIKVKKSKSEYLTLLKKDLAENDPKVVITTKVDDTIGTDAEVIVGATN